MKPYTAALWVFKFVGTLALLFAIPVVLFYGGLFAVSTGVEKYHAVQAARQAKIDAAHCADLKAHPRPKDKYDQIAEKYGAYTPPTEEEMLCGVTPIPTPTVIDMSQAIPLANIPSRVHAQQCAEIAKMPSLFDRIAAEETEKARAGGGVCDAQTMHEQRCAQAKADRLERERTGAANVFDDAAVEEACK